MNLLYIKGTAQQCVNYWYNRRWMSIHPPGDRWVKETPDERCLINRGGEKADWWEESETERRSRSEQKKKNDKEKRRVADEVRRNDTKCDQLHRAVSIIPLVYNAVPGHCFITHYGSGCLTLCRGIKGQDVLRLIEFQIHHCAAKPLHAVTVLKSPIIRPPGPVE